jgi:hypothetical protein
MLYNKEMRGFHVQAYSKVIVPLADGSEIIIDEFSAEFGAVPPYDIICGIGRKNGEVYLIARGLAYGYDIAGSEKQYLCIEINDPRTKDVRTELEKYIKSKNLKANIVLWGELNHKVPERQLTQLQLLQEPLFRLEDLSIPKR